jgi:hypothetical protein
VAGGVHGEEEDAAAAAARSWVRSRRVARMVECGRRGVGGGHQRDSCGARSVWGVPRERAAPLPPPPPALHMEEEKGEVNLGGMPSLGS